MSGIGHPPTGFSRPVALVTGGARRVGRAIALGLARAGCDVIITYNRSAEQAEQAVADLLAATERAAPAAASASVSGCLRLRLDDPDEVERFAEDLAAKLPRLDVLVHNASSYERTPLAGLTPQQAAAAYRVNALAPALLSKRFASLLAASPMQGGGAIVAMCDVHALGEHGIPRSRDFLAYSMSKAALAEMVRTLARELAPGVRVNGVAPGVVAFPETGHESDAASQAEYLRRVPLGRSGTPEDAAAAVRWLALEARYVTGQIIRVDGGRSLV
jgi:pteridine reductase